MTIIVVLLTIILFSYGLHAMDDNHRDDYRPRSASITIIEIQHPIAFKLVRNVLNGNTDPNVVKIIGKSLVKNKDGLIYPNLQEVRSHLPADSESYEGERQDYLIEYVIHELVDNNAKTHLDKKRERRQKYIIAGIGVTATFVSTAIAAISAYYIEK